MLVKAWGWETPAISCNLYNLGKNEVNWFNPRGNTLVAGPWPIPPSPLAMVYFVYYLIVPTKYEYMLRNSIHNMNFHEVHSIVHEYSLSSTPLLVTNMHFNYMFIGNFVPVCTRFTLWFQHEESKLISNYIIRIIPSYIIQ